MKGVLPGQVSAIFDLSSLAFFRPLTSTFRSCSTMTLVVPTSESLPGSFSSLASGENLGWAPQT